MVTDWTRHGECNHCGWCCETLSKQFIVRAPVDPQWVKFYHARGFEDIGDRQMGRFGWLLAPCPQHVDGQCAMQKDKPEYCRTYPTTPVEVVDSPCSYWFESGAVRVGGEGSPYPATNEELLKIERRFAAEVSTS